MTDDMTDDIITARLRQQVAELRAALDACAAASLSGAVIAALADGELTCAELAALLGRPIESMRYQIKLLRCLDLIERAHSKQTGGRGAAAYRLATGSPA